MAVYTEVFDDDLAEFLTHYDIGQALALKGIAEGVENSNYLLMTDQGPFILTLYEKRVKEGDLPYFLGLMRHFWEKGVACPQPVAGRDGTVLRRLKDRPAAIFTFLPGAWPRRPGVPQCGQLGKALAEMHLAGLSYPHTRANALSLEGWEALFRDTGHLADDWTPGLSDEIAAELAFLRDNWPRDLPTGVIHADLFPDNVFFLDGKLSGLIDFYFACNDLLAYDLCICLNSWCFESQREFNATKGLHMIAGYQSVRPLTDTEIEALPILARGAALRFLLTRLYDAANTPEGAMVTIKNPMEYVDRLHFHQRVRSALEYGLQP